MTKYIVTKYIQPTGMYKAGLPDLTYEETREVLIAEPGLVIERWSFARGEAEAVKRRPHIRDVFEEGYGEVPPTPPDVGMRSSPVTLEEARAYHAIPLAWEKGYRGASMKMAILDTGCAPELADRLGSRLVAKESFVEGEDWQDNSGKSHGSFCLQTVAEACPDAELISIKVLSSNDGSGYSSWIIKGIKRAVELGATSIGMSLGGPGDRTDAMCLTVDWAASKGVVVVCAAGNEQTGSQEYKADGSHPGCADGAVSCAAVDSDSHIAPFSNWGVSVDMAGLGVKVMQAGRAWSGTSMACPAVHAVVGLLGSAARATGKEPAEAKMALYAGARDTELGVYQEGNGVADALSGLQKMLPEVPPPQPPPPPPEQHIPPGEYFPGVHRTPVSIYAAGGYRKECVVTVRGTAVAYSVPKKTDDP